MAKVVDHKNNNTDMDLTPSRTWIVIVSRCLPMAGGFTGHNWQSFSLHCLSDKPHCHYISGTKWQKKVEIITN